MQGADWADGGSLWGASPADGNLLGRQLGEQDPSAAPIEPTENFSIALTRASSLSAGPANGRLLALAGTAEK